MRIKARKYVEILYDPDLRNWDAATKAELKRRGLEHSEVTVICKPLKHLKSGLGSETLWKSHAAAAR